MEKLKATQLLRDDHKKVIGLFRQFEAIDLRADEMKRGVTQEIFMELEIHSAIEEEVFYPAVASSGDSQAHALIDQSFQEHREAKSLIGFLRTLDVDSEEFNNRMEELINAIELHAREEEEEVFPIAEKVLGSQLYNLADRMLQRKAELSEQPKYEFARPQHAQNPNGGEQMRKAV